MSTMAARMTALVDVVPSFPCMKKAAGRVEGNASTLGLHAVEVC